jgi:hypothetical protein
MTNPDIICCFDSARMEVEEENSKRCVEFRHGFKYPFSLEV